MRFVDARYGTLSVPLLTIAAPVTCAEESTTRTLEPFFVMPAMEGRAAAEPPLIDCVSSPGSPVNVDVSPTNVSAPTDDAVSSMNSTRALSLSVMDEALAKADAPFQRPIPPLPGGMTISVPVPSCFVDCPWTVTAPE